MSGQLGFFDLSDRYNALRAASEPPERFSVALDFEVFRGPLIAAPQGGPRNKDGRWPFDPVLMFLVPQAVSFIAAKNNP